MPATFRQKGRFCQNALCGLEREFLGKDALLGAHRIFPIFPLKPEDFCVTSHSGGEQTPSLQTQPVSSAPGPPGSHFPFLEENQGPDAPLRKPVQFPSVFLGLKKPRILTSTQYSTSRQVDKCLSVILGGSLPSKQKREKRKKRKASWVHCPWLPALPQVTSASKNLADGRPWPSPPAETPPASGG